MRPNSLANRSAARTTAAASPPTVADALSAWARAFYVRERRRCARLAKEYCRCCECGATARLTDDVCNACGATSPVRVPRSAPVIVGAVALLLLLAVWCCL